MRILFFLGLFLSALPLAAQQVQLQQPVRFLALGDSYTIGEGVPASQRWPMQLLDSLAVRGIAADTLRIIATTGWRTDNLLAAISNQNLENQNYNLVSLLIGVNNQFQGRPFSQYTTEFPALLDSAIRYAGGNANRVFVVSIPDYAYTPYGQQVGNPALISQQLDQYNAFNAQAAANKGVKYFNITPISREGLNQPALVAPDGLHPSGLQYAQWVSLMLQHLDSTLVSAAPESAGLLNWKVFPNPADGTVTVVVPTVPDGPVTISLISTLGITLRKETLLPDRFAGANYSFSLQAIPVGMYLIRLETSGRQLMEQLLIR